MFCHNIKQKKNKTKQRNHKTKPEINAEAIYGFRNIPPKCSSSMNNSVWEIVKETVVCSRALCLTKVLLEHKIK